MPRVKQRTERLRERGVASALAILAEEGAAGLTTRTVARRAEASVPAIYEVFGDKAGLIREVFVEGFRMLGDELAKLPSTPDEDPIEAIRQLCACFRRFVLEHPVLAQTMFARPFVDFQPGRDDHRAGARVGEFFADRARRAVDAGLFDGDPADIGRLFMAFAEGLAAAESANRLGDGPEAADRRWRFGLDALIRGLQPAAANSSR